jgi:4-hydroxybenzoate polyprenyltransferase
MGAIFWTLGFDTIYGFQDIKDDEIIGIRSTSIKFKQNPKIFLLLCYTAFLTSLIIIGFLMEFKWLYFMSLLIPIFNMLFIQIKNFKIKDPINCLKIFKKNNFLGFLILLNILIGKIF